MYLHIIFQHWYNKWVSNESNEINIELNNSVYIRTYACTQTVMQACMHIHMYIYTHTYTIQLFRVPQLYIFGKLTSVTTRTSRET